MWQLWGLWGGPKALQHSGTAACSGAPWGVWVKLCPGSAQLRVCTLLPLPGRRSAVLHRLAASKGAPPGGFPPQSFRGSFPSRAQMVAWSHFSGESGDSTHAAHAELRGSSVLFLSCSFLEQLHKHQGAVLHPDYKTSFHSFEDALQRLLPYHVYQGMLPSAQDYRKGEGCRLCLAVVPWRCQQSRHSFT